MRSVAIWITTAVLLFAGLGTAALAATPHQPGVGWCTSQGNIGVIGDSISSGWELNGQATDNPTNPGIWVNWFASRYGATVDNQAVAGTSTANYVSGGSLAADTARIANDQNNLDFVMLGTNDWFLSTPPATYTANLESIYNTIRAGSPNASIVFVGQYDLTNDPNKPKGSPTVTFGQYMTAVTNAAAATGAGLVLSSQVVPAEGSGYSWQFLSDDTHLSYAGQWGLSNYVYGRMVALCGG